MFGGIRSGETKNSGSLHHKHKKSEREGFEPSVPLRVHVLSRDALSATQPSFHDVRARKEITLAIRLSEIVEMSAIVTSPIACYGRGTIANRSMIAASRIATVISLRALRTRAYRTKRFGGKSLFHRAADSSLFFASLDRLPLVVERVPFLMSLPQAKTRDKVVNIYRRETVSYG